MNARNRLQPANPNGEGTSGIPVAPLLATTIMQALATMAAFSLPAAAPEVARDLAIQPTLIGSYISVIYGVGIFSALLSPDFIRRFGAARVGQFVLVSGIAMLALAALAGPIGLAVSALVLGVGYGATAPVAAHLLHPRTPPGVLNLVLSIRQIGVPLGGVLAGMLVPPMVLAWGWKNALLVQIVPALLAILMLQYFRAGWDGNRQRTARISVAILSQLLPLIKQSKALIRLSLSGFVYAGIQLSFIAFMTVYLTTTAGVDLVMAGLILALYQVAGVISRPIWGIIADRWFDVEVLLALMGLTMTGALLLTALFSPFWPLWTIALVAVAAGASASGFTGVAYGAFAVHGGRKSTEATALGSAAMFSGVMILPSLFGWIAGSSGNYAVAYSVLALLAFAVSIFHIISRSQS